MISLLYGIDGSSSQPLLWVTVILTFWTFAITKSKILKFQISLNQIEILQSTFESTEIEVIYHKILYNFINFQEILRTFNK
jgi:hypothetical protein